MQTKQIVFTKPYTAELLEAEYLPPTENEVSVELEYSAISAGTEKANYIGMRNGPDISEDKASVFPRTVGYSAAGTVTAVGAGVGVAVAAFSAARVEAPASPSAVMPILRWKALTAETVSLP